MPKQFPHAATWSIGAIALAFLALVQWSHARTETPQAAARSAAPVEVVTPDRPDRYDFDGLTADVEGVAEVSPQLYHKPRAPQHRAIDLQP